MYLPLVLYNNITYVRNICCMLAYVSAVFEFIWQKEKKNIIYSLSQYMYRLGIYEEKKNAWLSVSNFLIIFTTTTCRHWKQQYIDVEKILKCK